MCFWQTLCPSGKYPAGTRCLANAVPMLGERHEYWATVAAAFSQRPLIPVIYTWLDHFRKEIPPERGVHVLDTSSVIDTYVTYN